MQYIADADGYLLHVSFGGAVECGGDTCTEYTGQVPSGYVSLEDWYLANADELYKWAVLSDGSGLIKDSSVPDRAVRGDWVVKFGHDRGASSDRYYRRWHSGKMEAWYVRTVSSVPVSTPMGALYRSDVQTNHTWPAAFLERPTVTVTFNTTNNYPAWVWLIDQSDLDSAHTDSGDTGATPKFYLVRPISGASVSGKVVFYGFGKWK